LNSKQHTITQIKGIIYDSFLTPEEKIKSVMKILKQDDESKKKIDNDLALVNQEISRVTDDVDYYDSLEIKSVKLQSKISGIIKHLIFDEPYSDNDLINAINYFKDRDGKINNHAPLTIFKDKELKVLFNEKGKIRISLYKILLFIKIAHGFKSGTLNLLHSYEYRAFAHYLIPHDVWKDNHQEYIERSGLSNFTNWHNVKVNLRNVLEEQYIITNSNIETKTNKYIKIDEEGKLSLIRYKAEENDSEIIDLFPKNKYISIYEVLSTVNEMTSFIDSFEHLSHKYGRSNPDQKTIIAGILGYGCNIGIHKIAKLSREINGNKLNNTVKMRFLLENLYNANNKVLSLIGKLELSGTFKKQKSKIHTASDGQKFLSKVDSVYANKSFKYSGNDGLVINSFIDDTNRGSGSERALRGHKDFGKCT